MATRKLPKSYIWRSILCIALGLILMIWPTFATTYIVTIIGTVLLTVGVILMIAYYSSGGGKGSYGLRFPTGALVCVVLGILLIAMPTFFAAILIVVLGLLLVLGALDQVWMLMQASKLGIVVSPWRYITPAVIFIVGIIIAVSPADAMRTMLIVFGVAAVLYGVIDLLDQALIRAGK
ncbi:MAG: DUF6131 family protein [Rikenellaceae bacterium]|jgi:uncharacterized membrane protein HdeD (DUF308 family)|nr:DUF6131 family protein [Rikenellaceae bacterium]